MPAENSLSVIALDKPHVRSMTFNWLNQHDSENRKSGSGMFSSCPSQLRAIMLDPLRITPHRQRFPSELSRVIAPGHFTPVH